MKTNPGEKIFQDIELVKIIAFNCPICLAEVPERYIRYKFNSKNGKGSL